MENQKMRRNDPPTAQYEEAEVLEGVGFATAKNSSKNSVLGYEGVTSVGHETKDIEGTSVGSARCWS